MVVGGTELLSESLVLCDIKVTQRFIKFTPCKESTGEEFTPAKLVEGVVLSKFVEVKAPPLPVFEEGGEQLRPSSSSFTEDDFRGDPVTEILSLSKPASILLFSLSLGSVPHTLLQQEKFVEIRRLRDSHEVKCTDLYFDINWAGQHDSFNMEENTGTPRSNRFRQKTAANEIQPQYFKPKLNQRRHLRNNFSTNVGRITTTTTRKFTITAKFLNSNDVLRYNIFRVLNGHRKIIIFIDLILADGFLNLVFTVGIFIRNVIQIIEGKIT
uniref:Uncharacterized protein n=1 Tax=Glossina brevipalpis TaxID=37001 RepID=A0A1A9WCA7_9MUSC